MVVLLSALCALPAAAQEYTLEHVRNEYRASIKKLNPIWMKCRLSTDFEVEQLETGRADIDGETIEWALNGPQFHFSWMRSATAMWFSYDGQTTWTLHYGNTLKKEDPRHIKYATNASLQNKTDSVMRMYTGPGQWLGMYIGVGTKHQSGHSVSSMLGLPTAKLIGSESIEGHRCVRVDLVYKSLSGKEDQIKAWFDPQVGFLIRRLERAGDYRFASTHEVTKFNESKSADGKIVWYPHEMATERGLTDNVRTVVRETIFVEEIRFGTEIPGGKFTPILPEGTPAFDFDSEAGIKKFTEFNTKNSMATPAREVAVRTSAIQSQAQMLPTDLSPLQPAFSTKGWTLAGTVFVAGSAFLLIAFFFRVFQKRFTKN